MPLYIVEKMVQGVMVLELCGQITLGPETELFRKKIRGLVAEGHLRIILDLADVDHIDSVGLSTLAEVCTTVRVRGGDLKLLHLMKRVHDILYVAHLVTVFEVCDSFEAARRSFERASVS